MGPCSGYEQQRDCLVGTGMVPSRFGDESNIIKQGEIVTGRPCGPIAQWSEYSHGLREVLGSSPGRAMCLFLPCDMCMILLLYLNAHQASTRRIRGTIVYMYLLNVTIRIFNGCLVRIENSVKWVTVRHHEACRGNQTK